RGAESDRDAAQRWGKCRQWDDFDERATEFHRHARSTYFRAPHYHAAGLAAIADAIDLGISSAGERERYVDRDGHAGKRLCQLGATGIWGAAVDYELHRADGRWHPRELAGATDGNAEGVQGCGTIRPKRHAAWADERLP